MPEIKSIQERTLLFGIKIVKFCNTFPKTPAGYAISSQAIRSGTSIGANIAEAQDALSHANFSHSINISLKEARETAYWLEII